MNTIKMSELLRIVIESAKGIGKTKNAPLTAERFFVAIIDHLNHADDAALENLELKKTKSLLGLLYRNTDKLYDYLMEYIQNDDREEPAVDLYMNQKLEQAQKKMGEKEVTLLLLTDMILCDPSDALRNFNTSKSKQSSAPQNEALIEDVFVEEEEPQASDEQPAEKPAMLSMAELIAETKQIRAKLKEKVFGQDNAINVFTTGYFQANLLETIEQKRSRPRATFLFAGSPGVGKTFLAETIAETLGLPFKRFDMSEYADDESIVTFCGPDSVYKNATPGVVTSFVDANPKCVLLFDEIEKAHTTIIHCFLQMLDAGRVRDGCLRKTVSFTDAIIILTTNAGKQLYEESENGDFSAVSRKVILKALQKDVNPLTLVPYFPAAICSRLASGNVVMFNRMSAGFLKKIVQTTIEKLKNGLEAKTGLKIEINDRVYSAIMFSEGGEIDARTVKSRAEAFFNGELYELLRLISSEKTKSGIDDLKTVQIDIDLSSAKPEITALFEAAEKTKTLVLGAEDTVSLCREKLPQHDIVGVQSYDGAVAAIKDQAFDLALLDVCYGVSEQAKNVLNLEDAASPARDFFHFLREKESAMPVYLLETGTASITEEEKVSFLRQGIRAILPLTKTENKFAVQIGNAAENMYRQAQMSKLARENKLVSFETVQTVSDDGETATVKLFDFKLAVAVDSEDSKNILSSVSTPNVTFDEVIGAEDAKKELRYFVEYLKNPRKYLGTGVKAPRGILLYGPPGTGKTMLAKAMAHEAGVTFIAAEGNQFLRPIVGEGPEAVHQLFRVARKYAPSILFVDEIDAIAKERRGAVDGSAAASEEILTAFLTEMDGFKSDPSKPVFVLAATNYEVEPGSARSLDRAMMRRFDRRVYIELPNKNDRIRFLHLKCKLNPALQLSEEEIKNISVRATGMSLAELDSVLELALRSAVREGGTVVTDVILDNAFELFRGGEAKKWDESLLERVARHEAGHAVLCWLSGETPSYLTVVARGDHGGYMQHGDQEGKAIYTKEELLARIRTSLGGRAAELVYYGEKDGLSTGASGDLASATNLARHIICTYGMDESFGLGVITPNESPCGTVSSEVRGAVNHILDEQMKAAIRLISENKQKMDALVELLVTKNHLNGEELKAVLG